MKRLIAAIVFLIAIIAVFELRSNQQFVSAQTPNTDWPQHSHDSQNSSYQPYIDVPTNTHVSTGGYKTPTWQFKPGTKLAGQTLSVNGKVVLTSVAGTIYVLNSTTGAQLWSAQAGGPIANTGVVAESKVIVATTSGKIIAYNLETGGRQWEYGQLGNGYQAALKYANGKLYIGNARGVFEAINVSNGTRAWAFQVGGSSDSGSERAAIISTAAILGGKVFFGAENTYIYALNESTGAFIWKRRTQGQSFAATHLVASNQAGGVVIARTVPVYSFHNGMLNPDDSFMTSQSGKNWQNSGLGSFAEWQAEQSAISTRVSTNSFRRTMWDLDPATGNDKYSKPIPVLYTSNVGSAPSEAVVDDAGNRSWSFIRSVYARFDSGSTVRQYADPVKLNLSGFNPAVYTNASLGQNALGFNYFPCNGTRDCMIEYEDFHKVGDEGDELTATRNALLISNWVSMGGIDLNSGSTFNIRFYGSDDTTENRIFGESFIVVANGNLYIRDSEGLKTFKVN